MSDIVDRLLEPDWHDPACPFLKHCYCDDGAPHDAVRHPLAREAADEITSLRARVEAMRETVVAFAGPWSATWAREYGLPDGHLHPTHYDILEKAGARMDDFTRAVFTSAK